MSVRLGGISLWARNAMLQALVGHVGKVEMPDQAWVSLLLLPANAASTGDTLRELEPPRQVWSSEDASYLSTGYRRSSVVFGPDGGWLASGPSGAVNPKAVIYDVAAASWGVVTGWAIATDEDYGEVIAYGTLPEPEAVNEGDQALLPVGTIRFGLDAYDRDI